MTDVSVLFDALVFDVGGVIIAHDNDMLFRRLAEHSTASDALQQIAARAFNPLYHTGAWQIARLHEELRRDVGYLPDWEGFMADWNCHFAVDQGMLDFVAELAASNRVILFSNTDREHWETVVALTGGALGKFEAYLSFEIGLVKPTIESFQFVAGHAVIEPGRSLFVDDLVANVEGARRAGFNAEVFVDQPALELFLADRVRPWGRRN